MREAIRQFPAEKRRGTCIGKNEELEKDERPSRETMGQNGK